MVMLQEPAEALTHLTVEGGYGTLLGDSPRLLIDQSC
jgi:hypothetical protein